MVQQTSANTPAPTIWEIPDEVWPMIQTIVNGHDPAKPKGHRRVDLRRVLNGIIFRLRTGCPWHHLPARLGTRAPCLATSSSGANVASWHASGPCWSSPATSWVGLMGSGKPPIPLWAKPGWGAIWWAVTPPTVAKGGETEPRG